jgi:hypothetical protein
VFVQPEGTEAYDEKSKAPLAAENGSRSPDECRQHRATDTQRAPRQLSRQRKPPVHGPGEREHDRSISYRDPLRQLALLEARQQSHAEQAEHERRYARVAHDLRCCVETADGGAQSLKVTAAIMPRAGGNARRIACGRPCKPERGQRLEPKRNPVFLVR